MAQRGAPDGWDPPSIVQVTVESRPRAQVVEARVRRLRTLIAASLVGAGVFLGGMLLSGGLAGGRHGAERAATAPAPAPAPAVVVPDANQLVAVADAYRFPLGCVSLTASDGRLRARSGPCSRYGVSVTAILRRVAGVWRLALEVRSANCPRMAMPALVLGRMAVCHR